MIADFLGAMTNPLRSSPVARVRFARAVLTFAAIALVALDVVQLTSAVLPRRHAAVGCSPVSAHGRSPSSGLFWLRLADGTATPLATTDPRNVDHPAVSPDGRSVAFLSNDNGILAELEVCDLRRHTTRPIRMPIPASDFAVSWDRSGKTLVFLGGDLQGYGADQRPFLVEPSGRRLRPLAGNSPWYYDGAAPSPDGTKVALLLEWKYPDGQEPEQLALLDLRTRRLTRVAGSAQVAQIGAMSWSPDGKQIVFDGYRQNAHGGLYVVDLATKRLTTLLVRGAGARAPAWSPDGGSIAFVRGGRRSSSIWLIDLRTRRQRQLTHGGVDVAPTWSPDASALVFVRRAAA